MGGHQERFTWPDRRRAALSLTFDDARASQVDAGVPILDQHDLKATFYVLPSNLEQRLDQWQAASEGGHEMGNHSLTHPCTGNFTWSRENALEELTLDALEQDLLSASDAIERALGATPTTFAYPCGQKTVGRGKDVRSYVPLVARHFLVGRGWLNETANDPTYCDLAQVTALRMDGLSGDTLKGLVDDAIANGFWLVLCSHEIGKPTPGHAMPSGVDPAHLNALCAYARAHADELWTDTVDRVGRYIHSTRHQPDPGRSTVLDAPEHQVQLPHLSAQARTPYTH